jgi:hypothetical protein
MAVVAVRRGSSVGWCIACSDYTELTISNWGSFNCSVKLQTTVVEDGVGAMSRLLYAATANGPDCSQVLFHGVGGYGCDH